MMRWLPTARRQPPCPHSRLTRLLTAALPDGGLHPDSTLRPWASANFVGARHLFRCTIAEATPLDALQRQLNAVEWRLPGHIVADLAVTPDGSPGAILIEILTVED